MRHRRIDDMQTDRQTFLSLLTPHNVASARQDRRRDTKDSSASMGLTADSLTHVFMTQYVALTFKVALSLPSISSTLLEINV